MLDILLQVFQSLNSLTSSVDKQYAKIEVCFRIIRIALKNLSEAAKLDPENANIHFELAMVYKDLAEYGKAETHFKKCLALKPGFADAWNNLGTLYLLTKQWDKAIVSFQKALAIDTYRTPHFAYNNMGLAYYNKGDYERAVDNFFDQVMVMDEDPSVRGNRLALLAKLHSLFLRVADLSLL